MPSPYSQSIALFQIQGQELDLISFPREHKRPNDTILQKAHSIRGGQALEWFPFRDEKIYLKSLFERKLKFHLQKQHVDANQNQ